METTVTPITSAAARDVLSGIKVIYTDIDGTLLAPGGRALVDHAGEPSTALAEVLVALRRAGIEVVPVTGRNRVQLTELGRALDLYAFIGEMGAVMATGQGSRLEVEYETGDWPVGILSPGQTPYEKIEQLGAIDALFAAFPGALEYHLPWADNREASHVLRGNIDVAHAREILTEYPVPIEILDNGIIDPPKHTLTIDGPIHGYHVLPAGISKARSVALDIERRGILQEQTLFIGDSLTDLLAGEATGAVVLQKNALADERVLARIAERTAQNKATFATGALTVDGWVEFANALLAAL